MEKSVLVSYLDRNKVIRIPPNCAELLFLEKEFKKVFVYGKNVNVQIIFQKFDDDWNEYVDLEETTDLYHKDKVKAVVTPLLADISLNSTCDGLTSSVSSQDVDVQASNYIDAEEDNADCPSENNDTLVSNCYGDSGTDDDVFLVESNQKLSKHCRSFSDCSDKDDDQDLKSDCKKVCVTPEAVKFPLKSKIKTEVRKERPIPSPFPWPDNFKPDVELALTTGKLLREAKASFYCSITHVMFGYRKFPTGDDYTRVATEIIARYPFLKPPHGSPTASIKQSLINRFKEFRRVPKGYTDSKKKTPPRTQSKPKVPGSDLLLKPPIVPPGEDETSFKRHNKVLLMESKKGNPNMAVVSNLMDRTFSLRRTDMLTKSQDITITFSKYPFLQNSEQLFLEMQRILALGNNEIDNLQSSIRNSWAKIWSPNICSKVSVEKVKNKRLAGVLMDFPLDKDSSFIASILYLVYMLPDPRQKPDHERVIWMIPEASDIEAAIQGKKQNEPFILILGTIEDPKQVFLIVDSIVVTEIDYQDILSALMCCFFVFNICYTKGCHNFYLFLEYSLFNMSKHKLSPSVSHFLAALHAHVRKD